MFTHLKVAALALSLSACAMLPNVEYRYHPARATTDVVVTQSVECTLDKTGVLITNTPAVVTTYASDPQREFTLRSGGLRSAFADSDITVGWFDDGRLKSINEHSTGQGEAIFKAALTLAATVIGGAAPQSTAVKLKACDTGGALSGDKPVAIVYELNVDHNDKGLKFDTPLKLSISPNSAALHSAVQTQWGKLLPVPEVTIGAPSKLSPAAVPGANSDHDTQGAQVTLSAMAVATIAVSLDKNKIWSGSAIVPINESYTVQIPQPKLFGHQEFSLALNEAGSITSLGYTSQSGTASALNVINAAAGEKTVISDAKANAIKSQADLIAQTQRLATCRASPSTCQ